MNPKKSLILYFTSLIISCLGSYIASRIKPSFFYNIGQKIGYEAAALIIIFLSLLILHFLFFIIFSNPVKSLYKKEKINLIMRLINKFKYPRYIKFKEFQWKITKDSQNHFKVSSTPICPKCCIPIIKTANQWGAYDYYCLNCETDFNSYNFYRVRTSIITIINSQGMKAFDKINKKPMC